MPANFDACVRSRGSRVRTIKPNSKTYLHLCYRRNSNKAIPSYVKHLKSSSRYRTKRIISKRKKTSKR